MAYNLKGENKKQIVSLFSHSSELKAMKNALFTIILILLTLSLPAQPCLDLGVKGGLTSSGLDTPKAWRNSENTLSYHVGAFGRMGWGRLFLQPEAYFNSRGGKLEEVFVENPVTTMQNFDFTSVDVPLLAGIKLVKGDFFNLRAMGGPVFGFITSGEVEGSPRPDAGYFRDHFYGWQYGVGVDLWFVTLDARIENSRNSVYYTSDFSARNKVFLISAGIKIF